jgi:chloride channel protein, CIC family
VSAPRQHLGDFTATPRLLLISALALLLGIVSTILSVALINLIALFTNLFFFQRFSFTAVSPAAHALGFAVIAVPVIGGLAVGLMARFGSERIRGHGIPEAIESILMGGSRVQARLALLKPLSAAISIGSGGPFGAEGPIIMTGGAFGSLTAQFFHFTSAERKTLLVAGAAAGMAATFATPLAAVLLGVELLLFEWKPRSFVPVAIASATAGAARRYLVGLGPLFPVPAHPLFIGPAALAGCVFAGLAAGVLSAVLTKGVYASEDAFQKLPIHWMWWPAIGGIAIGIGGMLFPQALGVGYDTIGALLQGDVPHRTLAGILLVKSTIWVVALGSGTSGGVLAPLLMMGGALGGVESAVLPAVGPGFWSLISMAAILGGTMRSPFTGIVFALELTHDINTVLPLLIAVTVAHGFTVLVLKRSILTEKVSRRGFHLTREYQVDPLEILFVREAMRPPLATLPVSTTVAEVAALMTSSLRRRDRLYAVVEDEGRLAGVVTRSELEKWLAKPHPAASIRDVMRRDPSVAYADEPLRAVAQRMAVTGLTSFPVVSRADRRVAGIITLADLLAGRRHALEAEQRRERVLSLPAPFSRRAESST